MFKTHGRAVAFFVVYIREAHALDGRAPLGGDDGNPIVEEPKTLGERRDLCRVCVATLDLAPIPALVDGLDNRVAEAYDAAPDRLYLVGKDGRIAYRSGPGPYGFRPDELEQAILAELGAAPRP
jgi:Iodothyronine deiodinase